MTAIIFEHLDQKPDNGVFLDSCFHHCGGSVGFRIQGETQSRAFVRWYEKNDTVQLFQARNWPCQDCCNGMMDLGLYDFDNPNLFR